MSRCSGIAYTNGYGAEDGGRGGWLQRRRLGSVLDENAHQTTPRNIRIKYRTCRFGRLRQGGAAIWIDGAVRDSEYHDGMLSLLGEQDHAALRHTRYSTRSSNPPFQIGRTAKWPRALVNYRCGLCGLSRFFWQGASVDVPLNSLDTETQLRHVDQKGLSSK